MPIVDSRSTRGGRRNPSIQTDVSTRYTGSPTPAGRSGGLRPVGTRLSQIALPESRAREIEDTPGSRPANELRERAVDCFRVRPLATQPQRLLQQLLVQHKTCAFHVHMMQPGAGWVKADSGRPPSADQSARCGSRSTSGIGLNIIIGNHGGSRRASGSAAGSARTLRERRAHPSAPDASIREVESSTSAGISRFSRGACRRSGERARQRRALLFPAASGPTEPSMRWDARGVSKRSRCPN